jgi:glycosyltransferase involved in cell wall biosynthesis
MSSSSSDGRKTVLLLVRELGIGGSERQMSMAARQLDPDRYRVLVGCFSQTGLRQAELAAVGIPVREFPVRSFGSWSLIEQRAAFRKFLREESVDVVHPFDYVTVLFSALGVSGTGVRFISSQRSHRGLIPLPYRWLMPLSDRVADQVVVNSESLRQELTVQAGLPPGQVRLVRNILLPEMFPEPPSGPRPRPGPLAGASLVVGCIAALRAEKDFGTLLRAARPLVDRYPGLRVLLVGSGPVEDELRALAGQLGLAGSCHFVPATAEVLPWLHSLDVFVLPSISEAMSNSLMEAMCTGCASIASAVGGNTELVTPEVTGLLFPAGDAPALQQALDRLLGDAALRQRLGQAARRFIVDTFSPSAVVRQLDALYRGN